MIGFYDYTVILTYGGLVFALMGIFQAFSGNVVGALLCMGGSLFCDTFDGKVARSKKNRTAEERLYGIQIDSLCDMVSFGVSPAVLCYTAGLKGWIGFAAIAYYCLCCVIRLAYFNVLETNRKPDEKSVFHGLPSPTLAMLMPLVFLVGTWIPEQAFVWVLGILLPLMGTLYILDFKMNKPRMIHLVVLCLVFWVPLAVLCFGK